MRTLCLLALPIAFLSLAACGDDSRSSSASGDGGSDASSSSSSSTSSGAGGSMCTPDVTVRVDDSFKDSKLNTSIWTLVDPIGLFDIDSGDLVVDQDDLSKGVQGTLQAGPPEKPYGFTTSLDATITFACTDGVQFCRIDVPLYDKAGDGKGPDVTVQTQHDSAGNPTYSAFSILDANGLKSIETGLTFSWTEASVLQIVFDPTTGALDATLTDGAGMEHKLQGSFPLKQYGFGVQIQGNSLDNGTIGRFENITTNLEMAVKGNCP